MRLRALGRVVVAGVVVMAAAVPLTAAQAEDCVPLPGSTTGATIEVGSDDVRVPGISGIRVCVEVPGLPGVPWVSLTGCGSPCASVVVTSGSDQPGHVTVHYLADGVAQEVGAAIPSGGGGGSETCYAGVGAPARADCFVKISLDDGPTPPPTPTAPPTPTVPPTPTIKPLPTVEPLPTLEPLNPICLRNPKICIDPSDPRDPIGMVRELCGSLAPDVLYCEPGQ